MVGCVDKIAGLQAFNRSWPVWGVDQGAFGKTGQRKVIEDKIRFGGAKAKLAANAKDRIVKI